MNELVLFLAERAYFQESSFEFVKAILAQNKENVNWDTLFNAVVANLDLIKYLSDSGKLLSFVEFLTSQGQKNEAAKVTKMFSLCRPLLPQSESLSTSNCQLTTCSNSSLRHLTESARRL